MNVLGHVLVVAGALVISACKREVQEASLPSAPIPSSKPVDRLAPGEIPEGKEIAFGLALPYAVQIKHRFVGQVLAQTSQLSSDQLETYFRSRVEGGALSHSSHGFSLERVHLKKTPDACISIVVRKSPGLTKSYTIDLIDVTPPKATPLPDDEARWREVGMSKDGRLLDPQHLH